jgi:NAD(P)-dependent dehydrogenase (short-subunit alcohol dehydrogenase family)
MMRTPGTTERPELPLAVIVGAGALGGAIARRLGHEHRLLIADRNEDRVMAFADSLRAEGHDASGFVCDITDADSVAALTASAGRWRTLVHVAALSPSMGDARTLFAVDLIGTLHVEQAFFETASPEAAAIFIASLAAHSPPQPPAILDLLDEGCVSGLLDRLAILLPGADSNVAYRVSKFAMNRMCRRRAHAWGRDKGARIVSLSPGMIATPMGAIEFQRTPAKLPLYQLTPLERECTMIEIANAVAFLASPAASFITGTDLLVDGGLAAAREFVIPS